MLNMQNPCKNDGLCEEDSRGNYRCSCLPNFTGTHCETEINLYPQCKEHCLNNATCRVASPSGPVQCVCQPGFTGARCEIDTNDCASEPCLNNGQCIDQVDSFRCNCTGTGYSGTLCQDNVNECSVGVMCLHGGICYDTYGSFICTCPPGYGGNRCEHPINECSSQPCGPGATCMDKHNGRFECICPNGVVDSTGKKINIFLMLSPI